MAPVSPDLTFWPQPGDYLSRNRVRGVATPPTRRPGPARVPMAQKAVPTGCPPFDQHRSRSLPQTKSDIPPTRDEMFINHLPAGCLEPTVHAVHHQSAQLAPAK